MHAYVSGERASLLPFGFTAAATLATGSVLLAQGDSSRVTWGAGWPLLTLGVAELAAGLAFNLQNASRAAALDRLLAEDPKAFADHERKKLDRIRHLFQPLLLGVEAAVAVGGGVSAAWGASSGSQTALGVGLGLAVQGLALFLLDWAVLDRASAYGAALDVFRP